MKFNLILAAISAVLLGLFAAYFVVKVGNWSLTKIDLDEKISNIDKKAKEKSNAIKSQSYSSTNINNDPIISKHK